MMAHVIVTYQSKKNEINKCKQWNIFNTCLLNVIHLHLFILDGFCTVLC